MSYDPTQFDDLEFLPEEELVNYLKHAIEVQPLKLKKTSFEITDEKGKKIPYNYYETAMKFQLPVDIKIVIDPNSAKKPKDGAEGEGEAEEIKAAETEKSPKYSAVMEFDSNKDAEELNKYLLLEKALWAAVISDKAAYDDFGLTISMEDLDNLKKFGSLPPIVAPKKIKKEVIKDKWAVFIRADSAGMDKCVCLVPKAAEEVGDDDGKESSPFDMFNMDYLYRKAFTAYAVVKLRISPSGKRSSKLVAKEFLITSPPVEANCVRPLQTKYALALSKSMNSELRESLAQTTKKYMESKLSDEKPAVCKDPNAIDIGGDKEPEVAKAVRTPSPTKAAKTSTKATKSKPQKTAVKKPKPSSKSGKSTEIPIKDV